MTWQFRGVDSDLSSRYNAVLDAAARAKPTPSCSGFFVRAAAQTLDGTIVSGGNHEYGINAQHAEETIGGISLEQAHGPLSILGFLNHGREILPCGNCRDYLLAHAGADLTIVNGSDEGGEGRTRRFKDLLYEPTLAFDVDALSPLLRNAISAAEWYRTSAKIEHIPPEHRSQVYGAAAVSENGHISGADFMGGDSYHGTSGAWNALVKARDHLPVRSIVITGPGKPSVTYRDRQFLAEFIPRHNAGIDVNILLAHVEGERPVRVWRTTGTQWLPGAFVLEQKG